MYFPGITVPRYSRVVVIAGLTYLACKVSCHFICKANCHLTPDRNFRLIRYYGFLANSVRGKLLPIVRTLLDLPAPLPVSPLNWRSMQYNAFGEDPMECILCGSDLIPSEQNFGYATAELQGLHYELANQKPIAC